MPKVNPKIMRWARETMGLTPEQATTKLSLRDAKGVPAVDRLAALEAGEIEPTRPMLVKMAKQYRRPLLTFYLSDRPRRGDRGQDFRTLPENRSMTADSLLDALIRNVSARQSMVRAVLEDEDDVEPLAFVGCMEMADGVPAIQSSIRSTIGVSLGDFRNQPSPERAFTLLRSGVESAGVFVLLMSNLGSYHTSIDLEAYRGFTISDDIAPFVIINDQDSPAAWSFTLLHELTHVWLGQTGVGGARAGQVIEQFCNDVASHFLLPTEEIAQVNVEDSTDIMESELRVSDFARQRNLSSSMVAYKLYRFGKIGEDTWIQLSEAYRTMWLDQRSERRRRARDQEKKGGPDYHVVRRHRVGPALISLVHRTMADGSMTTLQAGRVLGVSAKNVEPLLKIGDSSTGRQIGI